MATQTLDESEQIAPGAANQPGDLDFAADEVVFDLRSLSCFYGSFRAVREISLRVPKNQVTAII
ncbi:MAG: hypothetical protein M3406_17665, partial [Chloroflexota bacterium]|nr:hypothetical protein [Chloroflexota bacterium]